MKTQFTIPWKFPKLVVSSICLISVLCLFYTVSFSNVPSSSNQELSIIKTIHVVEQNTTPPPVPSPKSKPPEKTNLHHLVFGIAASARLWDRRKNYIKLWWKPRQMRGVVWLDKAVKNGSGDHLLPPVKISSDTSEFKYKNPKGHRSAIRISRIISETLRLGFKDVRWFVMGDDDTFFLPDNLVRVLSKYDHNQFYYIGSSSESHLQNINFSYGMAYGGGGFAISYPLAKVLAKMQDRCIQRYPGLYGSDDRIHACMAELGVPLTKEPGFHQYDVYGSLLGLLAAHPVAPLVSLHHLDVVEPIFPNMNRVQALKRLKVPINLDSAAVMQQSVCYDKTRSWTVSVSWGYVVQIYRGIFSVREMEMPARTFLNWYKRADYTGFSFNTRPVSRHSCQKPFSYYLSNALYNDGKNQTASEYVQHKVSSSSDCKWKMPDPSRIERVEVYKRPDPNLWDKAPRRNCCRVLPTKKKSTMVIDVGVCGEDEFIELR
ncbi:hypothetical protein CCACVL1_14090 [Corchorus capsularis]|uniref:Fringe-related protein n=1 Tax=Corchorus capsularis TaxID=210143 RepID=A0A1R3I8H7_COCAP|nr:hypothetical protein CCACVL1_14090 [Corchorus capsularis]